jgi:hypothetical protein
MDCHDVDSVRLRVTADLALLRASVCLWPFKSAESIRADTKIAKNTITTLQMQQ